MLSQGLRLARLRGITVTSAELTDKDTTAETESQNLQLPDPSLPSTREPDGPKSGLSEAEFSRRFGVGPGPTPGKRSSVPAGPATAPVKSNTATNKISDGGAAQRRRRQSAFGGTSVSGESDRKASASRGGPRKQLSVRAGTRDRVPSFHELFCGEGPRAGGSAVRDGYHTATGMGPRGSASMVSASAAASSLPPEDVCHRKSAAASSLPPAASSLPPGARSIDKTSSGGSDAAAKTKNAGTSSSSEEEVQEFLARICSSDTDPSSNVSSLDRRSTPEFPPGNASGQHSNPFGATRNKRRGGPNSKDTSDETPRESCSIIPPVAGRERSQESWSTLGKVGASSSSRDRAISSSSETEQERAAGQESRCEKKIQATLSSSSSCSSGTGDDAGLPVADDAISDDLLTEAFSCPQFGATSKEGVASGDVDAPNTKTSSGSGATVVVGSSSGATGVVGSNKKTDIITVAVDVVGGARDSSSRRGSSLRNNRRATTPFRAGSISAPGGAAKGAVVVAPAGSVAKVSNVYVDASTISSAPLSSNRAPVAAPGGASDDSSVNKSPFVPAYPPQSSLQWTPAQRTVQIVQDYIEIAQTASVKTGPSTFLAPSPHFSRVDVSDLRKELTAASPKGAVVGNGIVGGPSTSANGIVGGPDSAKHSGLPFVGTAPAGTVVEIHVSSPKITPQREDTTSRPHSRPRQRATGVAPVTSPRRDSRGLVEAAKAVEVLRRASIPVRAPVLRGIQPVSSLGSCWVTASKTEESKKGWFF